MAGASHMVPAVAKPASSTSKIPGLISGPGAYLDKEEVYLMLSIIVRDYGGPDVLELTDIPEPVAGPRQVIVEVSAAGVNFKDMYECRGLYKRELPFVPGMEAAGTVVALGPGVKDLKIGDRVAGVNFEAAYAQRALIESRRLIPIPDEISEQVAAAVLLQGLTAQVATHDSYQVRPGDVVLVHAAAGGTGQVLTRMVKLLGGRVIGTVSTGAKAEVARAAGADEVVNYKEEEDFVAHVLDYTGQQGVAAVYDAVGEPTFRGSLRCLRTRGTLVLYGQAGGMVQPFAPFELAAKSLTLTRPWMPHFIEDRESFLARSSKVFDWARRGALPPQPTTHYKLAEASAAHADLAARRTTGKLLIIP